MPDDSRNIGAIRWQHFRSLTDTGWLQLKPITVLLGANNAGKTSVIAPLLLLKQSLESQTGESSLLLTGPTLDLGTFSDVMQGHDIKGKFELGLCWDDRTVPIDGVEPPPQYNPGSLNLSFGNGVAPHEVKLTKFEVCDVYRRLLMRRERKRNGSYSLEMPIALQKDTSNTPGEADERITQHGRKAINEAKPLDFLFKGHHVFRERWQEGGTRGYDFVDLLKDPMVALYFSITSYVDMAVQDMIRSTYYVGPLREPPRRIYDVSGETPREVGRRGEFTPEILFRWSDDKSKIKAVHGWLAKFGFDEMLTWDKYGETAFAMCIRRARDAPPTSFLDVGFGMSQILPLIVQGLNARSGERIIIEQPEIHLNPRLQAKIADLLVSFAQKGVSVIVETHSEHLLLRMRRLIAEGKVNSSDVGLYFVERSGDMSTVRMIDLAANGHIQPKDWPADFFDDALRESLGLASAQTKGRRGDR